MTAERMFEIKQAIVGMTGAERLEISSHLLKLRHESAARRREAGRIMRAMDRGDKVPLKELVERLGLG